MNTRNASRPTLLLLHAFPLHSAMWEPQGSLADRAELYAPDFPGFGYEPGLDGESFTMEMAAQFIHQQLDARGIDRCVICGLSMGGYVALACWRMFPERIAGLILADTKASADTEDARKARYDGVERIGRGDFDGYIDETLGKVLAEQTRASQPDVVRAVKHIAFGSPSESAVGALLGMAARPDSTPLLSTISVPTALIFGEHDAVTSIDEGKKMAGMIPGAELTIIEEAGHLSNLENPDAFNRAVLALLDRVA